MILIVHLRQLRDVFFDHRLLFLGFDLLFRQLAQMRLYLFIYHVSSIRLRSVVDGFDHLVHLFLFGQLGGSILVFGDVVDVERGPNAVIQGHLGVKFVVF